MKKKTYTAPHIKELNIDSESPLMTVSPGGPGTGDIGPGGKPGSGQSARYDMVIDDDDNE